MITHNLALTSNIAQNVVEVASDGRITQRATIAEVLEANPELSAEFAADEEGIKKVDDIVDDSEAAPEIETKKGTAENIGKLIAEEEIAIGRVSGTSSESDLVSMVFLSVFDQSGSDALFPQHGRGSLLVFTLRVSARKSICQRVSRLGASVAEVPNPDVQC